LNPASSVEAAGVCVAIQFSVTMFISYAASCSV